MAQGGEFQQQGYWAWKHHEYEIIREQSHFHCDGEYDIESHALEPFSNDLGATITTFHVCQGRPVSAANALIKLWLVTSQEEGLDELVAAYNTGLRIAIRGFAPQDIDTRARFRAHFLRQLAVDFHRLPVSWLYDAIGRIKEAGKSADDEGFDLVRMANELLPELMAGDPPQPL